MLGGTSSDYYNCELNVPYIYMKQNTYNILSDCHSLKRMQKIEPYWLIIEKQCNSIQVRWYNDIGITLYVMIFKLSIAENNW